jgi:hypothetical protein
MLEMMLLRRRREPNGGGGDGGNVRDNLCPMRKKLFINRS